MNDLPENNRASSIEMPQKPAVIVCLEEEVYSPVSYLRIVRHLQDLTDNYRISVHVLPGQLSEALERIPHAALLIMARSRHESSFQAARTAADNDVPILCDIDDYVWEFPDYSKVERHDRIYTDEILRLAGCVTTPSEPLARLIREKHPAKNVHCIPNAGNVWSGSGAEFTSCIMANSDFFRVPELKADFFKALHDAAREAHKPLLLYYFSNDPPEQFTDTPHLRVIWMGFRSYSSYKQLIEHIRPEFGLVLLRDEEFSRYKSVVKFAEYGFTGTIGVYSRVSPYAGFIEDGVTGFLADNTYAGWKAAVLRVLGLDENARRFVRDRISRDVKEHFDYQRVHADFRTLLVEYAKPGAGLDGGEGNVPPRQAFTFRDAYAYAAWVMGVEHPRLQHASETRQCTPCRCFHRGVSLVKAGLAKLIRRTPKE